VRERNTLAATRRVCGSPLNTPGSAPRVGTAFE